MILEWADEVVACCLVEEWILENSCDVGYLRFRIDVRSKIQKIADIPIKRKAKGRLLDADLYGHIMA